MSDHEESGAVSSVPASTFADDYRALLAEEEEQAAGEPEDWLVPWPIEQAGDGSWAVLPPGQSLAEGGVPVAAFEEHRLAELCSMIIPASQREPRYTMGSEAGEDGFPFYDRGELAGHIHDLTEFDDGWLARMNILDALGNSPRAVSWFLAEAGGAVLEQSGQISLSRLGALEKLLGDRT
jgi:hypothetical protein